MLGVVLLANTLNSVIEQSLAQPAVLAAIPKNASSLLAKVTTTAQSSSLMRSESFAARIKNLRSSFEMLARDTLPTMTTMSSLPIDLVSRRLRVRPLQNSDDSGRMKDSITSTSEHLGLLTLFLM